MAFHAAALVLPLGATVSHIGQPKDGPEPRLQLPASFFVLWPSPSQLQPAPPGHPLPTLLPLRPPTFTNHHSCHWHFKRHSHPTPPTHMKSTWQEGRGFTWATAPGTRPRLYTPPILGCRPQIWVAQRNLDRGSGTVKWFLVGHPTSREALALVSNGALTPTQTVNPTHTAMQTIFATLMQWHAHKLTQTLKPLPPTRPTETPQQKTRPQLHEQQTRAPTPISCTRNPLSTLLSLLWTRNKHSCDTHTTTEAQDTTATHYMQSQLLPRSISCSFPTFLGQLRNVFSTEEYVFSTLSFRGRD